MLYFHLPKNYWFPPITKDCEHNSWIYRIINPSITCRYGQQLSNSRVKTHYNQIAPFGPITGNQSSMEKQLLLGDTCLACSGQRFLDFLTQPEEQAVGSGVCAEGRVLLHRLPGRVALVLHAKIRMFFHSGSFWRAHWSHFDPRGGDDQDTDTVRTAPSTCTVLRRSARGTPGVVMTWDWRGKALQTCREQCGGGVQGDAWKKWKDYITSCHREIRVSHWLTPNAPRVVFL